MERIYTTPAYRTKNKDIDATLVVSIENFDREDKSIELKLEYSIDQIDWITSAIFSTPGPLTENTYECGIEGRGTGAKYVRGVITIIDDSGEVIITPVEWSSK